MNYTEFLDYIYQRYSGNVKLGLERMTGILQDMSNPQNRLRGIHIGGTNGKGSSCATCEALAISHGLKTGLNTSPHLIDYCERFRINGKNSAFSDVLDIFHRFEVIFQKWDASFFEITTAIAFEMFAEQDIHTAIIEVGLGGRLDATNLFDPDISVITTIGLDHVKTLGATPELIAFEKAGIVKKGIPLVMGKIDQSPQQVIAGKAEMESSRIIANGVDYFAEKIEITPMGLCFDYKFGKYEYDRLRSNLLGYHQAANISNGLTAFLLYCEIRNIEPSETLIRQALQSIDWIGRMQVLQQSPTVIVDGAHNLQGIEMLVRNLMTLFPQKRVRFVVSILSDKDFAGMLKALAPAALCYYISKNESDRAAEIEEQVEAVKALDCAYKTAPTVRAAFELALSDSTAEDVIIGAGSLYTVAEIVRAQKKD